MKKNSIGKIALISTVLSGLLGMNLYAKDVSLEDKVSSLYVSYFDRAPDYSGLNYWVTTGNTVLQQGGDVLSVLKDLSAGFAQHPTFVSTYSSMSDEDFVKAIYRNSLGKEGDAQGVEYWTTLLTNGKSRSDMVAEFMNLSLTLDLTPENFPSLSQTELDAAIERQKLITNKVNVAKEFANILTTATNVEDSQNPENDPAYLASKKVLENVGLDESSVDDAIGKIYALRNENSFAINDILNNWQGIQADMGFKNGTSTGEGAIVDNNIVPYTQTSIQQNSGNTFITKLGATGKFQAFAQTLNGQNFVKLQLIDGITSLNIIAATSTTTFKMYDEKAGNSTGTYVDDYKAGTEHIIVTTDTYGSVDCVNTYESVLPYTMTNSHNIDSLDFYSLTPSETTCPEWVNDDNSSASVPKTLEFIINYTLTDSSKNITKISMYNKMYPTTTDGNSFEPSTTIDTNNTIY